MNTEQFIDTVNKLRLQNKNNWYYFIGIVNNKEVRLKGYNTWIQRTEHSGIKDGYPSDVTVNAFKDFLKEIAEYN